MSTQVVMDAVDDLLTEVPELETSVAYRRLRRAVTEDAMAYRDRSEVNRQVAENWARQHGAPV